MATTGRVVVLNGTSSSGKSTLAKHLQARFVDAGECRIIVGLDPGEAAAVVFAAVR
jgi:chloramphenicol 3-O-phosphotransferase